MGAKTGAEPIRIWSHGMENTTSRSRIHPVIIALNAAQQKRMRLYANRTLLCLSRWDYPYGDSNPGLQDENLIS